MSVEKEIPLTKGYVAVVDEGDYEILSVWRWRVNLVRKPTGLDKVYAVRGSGIYMHRHIMDYPKRPLEVDHINGDGLDNRRGNLRVATRQQNLRNRQSARGSSSKYLGVTRDGDRWRAQAPGKTPGQPYTVGRYETEEEAALARDRAVLEIDPKFFRLNFPEGRTP